MRYFSIFILFVWGIFIIGCSNNKNLATGATKSKIPSYYKPKDHARAGPFIKRVKWQGYTISHTKPDKYGRFLLKASPLKGYQSTLSALPGYAQKYVCSKFVGNFGKANIGTYVAGSYLGNLRSDPVYIKSQRAMVYQGMCTRIVRRR